MKEEEITSNKKDLLVTLTDANFVRQAKQLFSSVYFNSGWQGDYMLIANDLSVEDYNWFVSKGVIVYDKPLLSNLPAGAKNYPPIILSKFYLFQEEFKKWRKIIFLDADIIVEASLDGLLSLGGFSAPPAVLFKLSDEFVNDKEATAEIRNKYNFKGKAFCVGAFCFDSAIITPDTFSLLLDLYNKFGKISNYGDESILNLFFYKNWNKLSLLYNTIPWYIQEFLHIKRNKMLACVFHFPTARKPWDASSPYYEEWTNNLKKAEQIDLSNRLPAKIVLSAREINSYDKLLIFRQTIYPVMAFFVLIWRNISRFIFWLDSLIGLLGLFIKRKNPKLYSAIKLRKQ